MIKRNKTGAPFPAQKGTGMKNEQTIGIIGAMASEVEILTAKLQQADTAEIAGVVFHQGLLEGKRVVIAQCGIGKVCAAICAQAMIDRYKVAALINTGVAGGLHPSLAVGDIVISTDAVQHDFDMTAFGYVKGYMGGGDGKTPTRYIADPGLIANFKAAADEVLDQNKYIDGTIASGDVFVDDSTLKKFLIQQFGAAAAEMEGASIAQVAAANRVPFVVIRSISDLAEHEATISFEEFEKKAAEISSRIVLGMLRR